MTLLLSLLLNPTVLAILAGIAAVFGGGAFVSAGQGLLPSGQSRPRQTSVFAISRMRFSMMSGPCRPSR